MLYERMTGNTDGVLLPFTQTNKNMKHYDVIKEPFEGLSNAHIGNEWSFMEEFMQVENGMLAIQMIVDDNKGIV